MASPRKRTRCTSAKPKPVRPVKVPRSRALPVALIGLIAGLCLVLPGRSAAAAGATAAADRPGNTRHSPAMRPISATGKARDRGTFTGRTGFGLADVHLVLLRGDAIVPRYYFQ